KTPQLRRFFIKTSCLFIGSQFQFTLVIHGAQERNNGFGGFFIQLTTQLVHGHFFYRYVQRGGFAVVEVRGSGADVTQGRYFKDVHIRRVVGYCKTTFVGRVRVRLNQTHFLLHMATQQRAGVASNTTRSEEHTSELQSRENLVCRLLLEQKKRIQ